MTKPSVALPGHVGSGLKDRPEPRTAPIDAHVGGRVRLRRTLLGMSQEKLGDALGLTFQQVQKYERGINRVGASRLFDLARVLDVPIGFFFDDLPPEMGGNVALRSPPSLYGLAEISKSLEGSGMHNREAIELVRAYCAINEPAVRKRVLDLVKSLAPSG